MVRLFGEDLTKRELLRRVGSLDQVAGTRRLRYEEGPEDGVGAIEVRTGGGLRYTVLPSRALDIAAAECDGVPIAWRTAVGDVHPAYSHLSLGWNAAWFGGLLATCGLDNVGSAGEDELGSYPQHGWLNGVAARQVGHGGRWQTAADQGGDRYTTWVEGELREATGWGPGSYDVALRRRIESDLGGRAIRIVDRVENLGQRPAPLMIQYHFNLGYPLVGPGAEIVSRRRRIFGAREAAEAVVAEAPRVGPPSADYRPVVHFHELVPDAAGDCEVALVNPTLAGGLGVALRFPAAELPFFKQWKALLDGRNVVAIEPGNCWGFGRAGERERGTLASLAPGEERSFHVELTVLRGAEEIAALRGRLH
jgi:hypothetical protein